MQCRAWRSDEVGGENKDPLAWRIRRGARGNQLCEAEQRRGLIGVRYLTQNVLDERARRQESFRPAVAGLRSGKHSLHADFISCHPADDHTFCNPKLNKHMKKSVLSLITVLIGIAFIASCAPQQGGTTATSTTAAATKSPSPSPTHKKRATTKKKKAPETEASPSPAEGAASPSPTP